MRAAFGTLAIIAGLVLVYLFGVHGGVVGHAARSSPGDPVAVLPFKALGTSYPKDALCLVAGAAAAAGGLWMLIGGRPAAGDATAPAGPWGGFARGFLLLSVGSCAAWWVAWVGAVNGAVPSAIGGFVAVAGVALAEALLLGILAFVEKPKRTGALVLGWLFFLASAGAGAAGILGGR